jgi:AraC-like DNA-binding protein
MKVIYEKRNSDIYYRNDNGFKWPLQCRAHLHYHVEIVYLREGSAKAYIDSETLEFHAGDLLVVFPNKIHRFEDEIGRNRYDLFIVNPDLAEELAQRTANEDPKNPVIKNASSNSRLMSLIEILRDSDKFPASCKSTLLKGYFTSFFAEILEMMPTKSAKHDENQAMRALVQYCSHNFTKELSLAILEEELHLSKYYISHLFGNKLGISFNEYINSLRISEACRLLRMTDMSITEISDASGFGTLRTFNRSFIKQMGMSPSSYRKNDRGEAPDVSIPEGQILHEDSTEREERDEQQTSIFFENYTCDEDCDSVIDSVCDNVCGEVCDYTCNNVSP